MEMGLFFNAAQVEKVPTVKGKTHVNEGPANAFPSLHLSWDQDQVKITPEQVYETLKSGTPSIVAGRRGGTLRVGVVLLRPDQVDIVAQRVREMLEQAV